MRLLVNSSPRQRPLRRPGQALAAAFLLAIAIVLFTHHRTSVARQGTPQATVRDFLDAAVVDGDGFTACRYLTTRARMSFQDHAPNQVPCESFFGETELTLGGLQVQSEHDLDALSYKVVPVGATRRVTVSHGGQSISFVLRRGTAKELNEFHQPPTLWRIDSSVAMLAAPQTASPADF